MEHVSAVHPVHKAMEMVVANSAWQISIQLKVRLAALHVLHFRLPQSVLLVLMAVFVITGIKNRTALASSVHLEPKAMVMVLVNSAVSIIIQPMEQSDV